MTKDKDFMGLVFVTAGTFIGSFFSYLLQFILGRTLTIEDYGLFNALLSLAYLMRVPFAVFGIGLVKVVSEILAQGDYKRLTALFWKLVFFSLIIGIVVFFGVLGFSSTIQSSLQIQDFGIIVIFGIFISLTNFNVIPASYLQGLLRYKAYGFYNALNNLLRFAIPTSLVLTGFGVGAVLNGMSLGMALSFIIAVFLLAKNFTHFENLDLKSDYKRMFNFMLPVFFVKFGLMFLNNIDMVMVKKFFDPVEAGYYAGTVTLGKILLFGASTVALVMFPKISELYTKNENYIKQFKMYTYLQLLAVIIGIIGFSTFPKLVTRLFFGSRFDNSIAYLPAFSIFIGLYVLVNYFITYLLAVNRTNVFIFLIPAIVCQYILLNVYNRSISNVIYANLGVVGVLLSVIIIYILVNRNKLKLTQVSLKTS